MDKIYNDLIIYVDYINTKLDLCDSETIKLRKNFNDYNSRIYFNTNNTVVKSSILETFLSKDTHYKKMYSLYAIEISELYPEPVKMYESNEEMLETFTNFYIKYVKENVAFILKSYKFKHPEFMTNNEDAELLENATIDDIESAKYYNNFLTMFRNRKYKFYELYK